MIYKYNTCKTYSICCRYIHVYTYIYMHIHTCMNIHNMYNIHTYIMYCDIIQYDVYIYIYLYMYIYISGWRVLGTERALAPIKSKPVQMHGTNGMHAQPMAWHGLEKGIAQILRAQQAGRARRARHWLTTRNAMAQLAATRQGDAWSGRRKSNA